MADETENEEIDDEAVAAEWAAMAGAEDDAPDDDAVAAEWEAMAAGDAEDDDGDGYSGSAPGRVLDQDEIDSLLGFDGEDDGGDSHGIQALINSALVSYERLPMLDIIFDRMVRMMSTSLRNFTSDNIEVSLDNITSVRFGDYLNSIPLPAMLAVFRAEEWDNYGLMTVDSSLIYSIVDVLLGGRRGTAAMRIEGRPYTTIEQTLVERMIAVILKDMSAAFEPLSPTNFTFDRLETNPRFATIARPPNAAVLIKLRIDMEDRGGRLELLYPYATLEPVRELLLQRFMGEKFGRDSIWETHLATELWSADLQLRAVLDEQVMSLRDVMNLQVGQTIQLNVTPQDSLEMRCGEVTLLNARMGRSGQKLAVQVNNVNRLKRAGRKE
ncbi:flagellar motor switch protein FliM [Iodidimonas nitroreducens]|uniref:Flagellar motor switch protein FliM n=1 Tax=Iodidimonas nitroreducens TaxID=1236968 RepID=A0A5A7N449_9PROT|nr:flagellar motor switch protein FliM [Iodidimonas nitroreducens]GAK32874.1 flagellar motor switch protein FliM [alpha proteobacterium Q-1]GER03031.1 flagellar motor switch protein FliM [Iodidimonas nitroreducens]